MQTLLLDRNGDNASLRYFKFHPLPQTLEMRYPSEFECHAKGHSFPSKVWKCSWATHTHGCFGTRDVGELLSDICPGHRSKVTLLLQKTGDAPGLQLLRCMRTAYTWEILPSAWQQADMVISLLILQINKDGPRLRLHISPSIRWISEKLHIADAGW